LSGVLERTYLHAYSLRFSDFIEVPIQPLKQIALQITTEQGENLGTIGAAIYKKWELREIPHEPGTHKFVIGSRLQNEFAGRKQTFGVDGYAQVKRTYYAGPIPIHLKGFFNVRTGGTITSEFVTGIISPREIETGKHDSWKEIGDPSKLEPKPVLRIGYSDVYSSDSEWAEGTASVWPKPEDKQHSTE